jgi:excisionase family DNA binding protein
VSARSASRAATVADRSKPEPPVESFASPLLDAKAAARLFSVPASWVLAEARADRIPHVRLGRYVRFDAAELEAWWRTRARGPWRRYTGSDPVGGRRNAA